MSFENADFREEVLDLENPFDVKFVSKFLKKLDFDFSPGDVDYTMVLYTLNDEIIGTGSFQNHVLKYVAVVPEYRSTAAFSQIVTHLMDKLLTKHKNIFVYTLPRNTKIFEGLGFTEIATAQPLFSVLEFGYENIKTYQEYLRSQKQNVSTGPVSAIVVNCNPFTNGHKYLIEKAAEESRILYLFVVEEDRSSFPFNVRWKLISEGIAHLNNVVMLRGGDYVVSGAIFPSYFLKNENPGMIAQKQGELDIRTFISYIVPVLGITRRYVGTEKYDPTTRAYNNAMKALLPRAGVELIEIERKKAATSENEESIISASKVRRAIKENKLNDVIKFLPETTRRYLNSPESQPIIKQIESSDNRH